MVSQRTLRQAEEGTAPTRMPGSKSPPNPLPTYLFEAQQEGAGYKDKIAAETTITTPYEPTGLLVVSKATLKGRILFLWQLEALMHFICFQMQQHSFTTLGTALDWGAVGSQESVILVML